MTDDKNKKPAPAKQQGHETGIGASAEKPKNFGKSMKQILRYSGNYK